MIIKCGDPGCRKRVPPSSGARPRLYCNSTCRSRAYRAKGKAGAGGESGGSEPAPGPAALSLAAVTRRDLDEAGRLDTFAGQQALAIAEQMVAPGTRSSFATLNKELTRAMAEAMAGVKPRESDAVDEFTARLREKQRAASA